MYESNAENYVLQFMLNSGLIIEHAGIFSDIDNIFKDRLRDKGFKIKDLGFKV